MNKTDAQPDKAMTTQARCLVLIAKGLALPQALEDAMAQREVDVVVATDAPSVMVYLTQQRFQAMILVEPDAMPQSKALVRSVQRYHGDVVVWRYCASATPVLAPLTELLARQDSVNQSAKLNRHTSEPVKIVDEPGDQKEAESSTLRFTQDDESAEMAQNHLPDLMEDQSINPLLTEEELGMLLGEELDEKED